LKRICLILSLISLLSAAQAQPEEVSIKGKVLGEDQQPVSGLIIANTRTGIGGFGNLDGTFLIRVFPKDTILITARGYQTFRFCAKDSVSPTNHELHITLKKLSVQLKEVTVYSIKKTTEIREEIKQLGKRNVNTYQHVNPISSPITALWERFSKMEKAKRQVEEWENNDRKAKILKELFRTYIAYDIIDLSDDEFDDFIAYLNLSDEFMQNSSDYELARVIKAKYITYRKKQGKIY